MAQIELTRPSGYKTDRLRAYQIYIDGEKVSSIKPGETEVFTLSLGRHELQLKQDWASSEKLRLDLGDSERAQFICAPRVKQNDVTMMTGFRVIFWATLGCRRYIDLRPGNEIAAAENEPKQWPLGLDGPKLFGIALLIGIAYWALTGQNVVAVGVVVGAMAFVAAGLVGRGIGKATVRASEKVQKRRGDEGSRSSE